MPAHRRISQGVRTSGSASSNFSRTRDVILFTFYWPSIATELVALESARNHHWVDWFGKIWKRNPVDWTEKGIRQNNPGKSQRFPHEQHSKWHYHSSSSLLKTNESPEDSTGARTVGFQKSSPSRSNMGIRFGIWRRGPQNSWPKKRPHHSYGMFWDDLWPTDFPGFEDVRSLNLWGTGKIAQSVSWCIMYLANNSPATCGLTRKHDSVKRDAA